MAIATHSRRTELATSGPREEPTPQPRRSLRQFWPQYVAVAPFYVLFAIFGLFPIVFSIVLSFTDWDGIGAIKFAGLSQYRYLVTDPRFWTAVWNTVVIWVISTVPMLFLALLMAFILHQNIRFKGFYRIAFFIPNVTSLVAVAVVFSSVFSDSFGLVNSALTALHIGAIPWLSSSWGIKVTIAVMVIWRYTGYNAIIYLTGLQSVNTELYEAARVDGASTTDIFFRITIPLLRPVILFTVITSTIGGLSLFTEPQVLFGTGASAASAGGPGDAGMTIVLYQYVQAFFNFDFGYASAIAWALFVLSAIVAFVNFRLLSDRDDRPDRKTPLFSRSRRSRRAARTGNRDRTGAQV